MPPPPPPEEGQPAPYDRGEEGRLGGTLEKPGDLIRRLDLGEVTSDDLADDIAGLFVSRGVG